MILIGISGKQGTGKDVVGDHLVDGYGFKKYAFADKLKQISMELWGLSYEECYTNKTERSRFIMQKLGTEVGRVIDENTWINYLLRKIKEDNVERAVIVDCRFPNEADAIIKEGGQVWRISRTNTLSTGGEDHPSEIALDDYKKFYRMFNNNYTIKDLHFKIDEAMIQEFPDMFDICKGEK